MMEDRTVDMELGTDGKREEDMGQMSQWTDIGHIT